jgi:hypothetical protein
MLTSNLFDSYQHLLVDATVSSANHCTPQQVWHYQACMVQPLIEDFCIPKIQVHNSLLISELLYIWTSSITQYSKKLKNTTFWKLDPFPLEMANLNHWSSYFQRTQ